MMGLPPQALEKIGLTDEQKQKAAEIFQKYRPQLEEITNKMREEFRALLTDEQKKKWDEAREEMRQRFGQGRGGAEKGAGKGRARPEGEKEK
jgi:Spy/CpxP family protein refolding chaperone